MHHHPEFLLVLHKERQARLEVEAARHALIRSLRRRRRRWWRRPEPGTSGSGRVRYA
jgi:hypothetical protein